LAYAVSDPANAFAIQKFRTGIMGSHSGVGFFIPVVFTGLAVVLLVLAVRDAKSDYEAAKKQGKTGNHARH